MTEPEQPEAEWPIRRITEAESLRALAHPLRLRLVELLAVHGPATATELAERVGHSPANCSWHLRQLAASGFIEEAEGGKGRQRIWKFVPSGHSFSDSGAEAELADAADAASAIQLEHELSELRAWRATKHTESAEWAEAAAVTQSILWLTPAELRELNDQVRRLLLRRFERHLDPATRPEGARPVRLLAWGFPAKNLENPE